jgi:mannose-1-phosphate guanylyltransferase
VRAMLLSAGLGTRLRPLTCVRPKALVPVMGTTVIDFWLSRLSGMGFAKVVLNAFHLPEKIVAAGQNHSWDLSVEVRVEQQLLGTGGGIRNALDCFEDEPIVVINGDILCSAPLTELYQQHLQSEAAVSMLLHDWPAFNNVAVDTSDSIRGFGNEALALSQEDPQIRLLAFTGIHFLRPGLLSPLPQGEPADILTVYRQFIRAGHPPRAIFSSGLFWREMGSIEAYWALSTELTALPRDFLAPLPTGRCVWKHPQAVLAADVQTKGVVVLGAGSSIMSGAVLENVIVWDAVKVEENSILRRCVITDGVTCRGEHTDEILLG